MKNKIIKFFKEEDGATAVEYCIMAAGIAAMIVAMVVAVGLGTKELFETTTAALDR